MGKNKAEKIEVVYYWQRSDGKWGMQIVHNTCYSELECAVSEAAVKKIAAKLGYKAVREVDESDV